jgi:hypothetical protein
MLRERIDPSLEVSPLGSSADSFEYSSATFPQSCG